MLYVFHVDCGRMMKFDMNMALSKVEQLKHTIELLHGYSAMHQVLLVSGGEMLQPGSMVCSYSAGTDTNPIYMFTTEDPVDSKNNKIPWPSIEPIILDVDLKDQVERCLALPATYSTVVQRAQLAQQIFDLAREEETICERLVHEQHLQQQGWSAVIANMEDLVSDLKERYKHFCNAFGVYTGQRESLIEALKTFEKDVEALGRIPVLPNLLKGVQYDSDMFADNVFGEKALVSSKSSLKEVALEVTDVTKNNSNSQELVPTISERLDDSSIKKAECMQQTSQHRISLLQWMSLRDNHMALRTMSDECMKGMEMLDDRKVQLLKTDILNIMKMAEQEEIKEIKGLEDRLCGLEKLMFDLKKIVQEQRELATAFQQNQNRASNLGDPSILPDLCASHRSQLLVMLQSQRTIRDIRRRISKAKEELSDNLYKRLKYIVHIENTMLELANNLLFYHRCLRRIDCHLSVIKQIHEAPTVYVTAVIEVVRRRLYSTAFTSWASSLASDLLGIYKDEITRRQEFDTLFRGHFLGTLFPGLTDMPPEFATEVPTSFDECLPELTKGDVETLSTYLPDVTSNLTLSCIKPVIEFFNSRSGNKTNQEKSSLSGRLQSIGGAQLLPRPIEIYSHLKDGFESETDTEEFEKVGQSPSERKLSAAATTTTIATSTSQLKIETMTISTTTEPVTVQSVETLTEDNLGSTTLEVERLKGLLRSMSQLSLEALTLLRSQIQSMRAETDLCKSEMQDEVKKLTDKFSTISSEYDKKEIEKGNSIKEQHEIELAQLRTIIKQNEDELAKLKTKSSELESENSNAATEKDSLKRELLGLEVKVAELEARLEGAEADKERAIAEYRDTITREHKTEIESLRCRFKLMTNMERSPSDLSLEKIERPDVIDITSHESIIQQLCNDFELQKTKAIEAALESERAKWAECQKISSGSPNSDTLRKVVDEKEKQLDLMRERDLILSKENAQLKLKIEALASEEESDRVYLKDQLEILNKEKIRIEQELNVEKTRRVEMESSVATMKLSCRDLDSGSSSRSKPTSSQSPLKLGVQIESCNKGDTVFIVWNNKHGQYIIVQDSSTLYFLHGDSHSALNLKAPSSTTSDFPEPYYCVGRVVDKEYCHARKDENRYKVSKGTKFYRVKVQPIIKTDSGRHMKRERNESTSSASSVAVSRSTSTQHLIDSFAQTDTSGVCSSSSRDMTDSIDIRDRTISVTEEDEEQLSLRYRCVSFSEEEERTLEPGAASPPESTLSLVRTQDYNIANTTSISTSTSAITTSTNPQPPQSSPPPLSTESLSEKDQDDSDEYRSLEAKDEFFHPE